MGESSLMIYDAWVDVSLDVGGGYNKKTKVRH